jgi:hypothetical protein
MSTLKVNTIQDTNNGNVSSTAQIYQGRSTAWVNFNGQGTIGVRDDYNVNSLTDHSTGRYTVTFSSAFSNNQYCALGNSGGDVNNTGDESNITWASANYTSSSIYVRITAPVVDPVIVNVAVFGGT